MSFFTLNTTTQKVGFSSCYNPSKDSYGYSCRAYCRGRAIVYRSAMDLSLRCPRVASGAPTYLLPDQASARAQRMDNTSCRNPIVWLERTTGVVRPAGRLSLFSSIPHHYADTDHNP